MKDIKKFMYSWLMMINGGVLIALYASLLSIVFLPSDLIINEALLKAIFMYLVLPLVSLAIIGIVLMIIDVFKKPRGGSINMRLWIRIILSSWFFGALLYYYQVFKITHFQEQYIKNHFFIRFLKRAKSHRLFLDILFGLITGSSMLFIVTWLIFLISPMLNAQLFQIFWIYPLKSFAFCVVSWMMLYYIAIADRAERTDEEVRKIDPLFVDFPYIINIGKGLLKYYRKILRRTE